MKRWVVSKQFTVNSSPLTVENIIKIILENRGLTAKKDIEEFLSPPDPHTLKAKDIDIDSDSLKQAFVRIHKAIKNKESIVVYADYDADGITAGAIMWETLHKLGAAVMPYIPHRVEEGYGLSLIGIDKVRQLYDPALIITVDHGITARSKVAYAKKFGIDVIVTDHHVQPKELPDCITIHTTKLCGAGVSWFVAKELLRLAPGIDAKVNSELVALVAIGTIADMVPIIGANRSIVKAGLTAINNTSRVGLNALINESGLRKGEIKTYEVSHVLAPRLNAMGRLEHALDALRLLCTNKAEKADLLAKKLGLTNKDRQQLTVDTTSHALQFIASQGQALRSYNKKIIFIGHETYNQGVIGLVAGKIVEEYYRPAIVVAIGEEFSKASARSISGFNIVEAIRQCSDILVDVGGHPMAAGFTVETKHLPALQFRLEKIAEEILTEELLMRTLKIDLELPLSFALEELWKDTRAFEPFGFGNPEPVFASTNVSLRDVRLIGTNGKHLKLRLQSSVDISQPTTYNLQPTMDAVAFGMGAMYKDLKSDNPVDIAYTIDMNEWNGSRKLQLKIKDIQIH